MGIMGADGGSPTGFPPPRDSRLVSHLTPGFFRDAGVGVLKGLDAATIDAGDTFIDLDPGGRFEILTTKEALDRIWERSISLIPFGSKPKADFFRDVARHWGVVAIEKFQAARQTEAFQPVVPWLTKACAAAQVLMPAEQDQHDRDYLCGLADSMALWAGRRQNQDVGATKR